MRIQKIKLFTYDLTFRHGTYKMSGGRAVVKQLSWVVAVESDTGVTGWAEVSIPGGTYLPAFEQGVRAAISELAPALVGADALDIRGAHRIMDGVLLEQRVSKSPFDIALWDLLGRVTDQPIATLTGGIQNKDFPLYWAVPLDAPEVMVDFVEARMEEGIRSFQIKVGNEPERDAERVRAVLNAVPEDVIIFADANAGWSIHDARKAVKLIGDAPIYIEQPCRSLEDNILVSRHMPQQLILDESIATLEDLYRAKYEAGISAVNIKLSRVGGFSKALQIRDAAQVLGLKVSMEDTWGGDIASAAVNHLAATTHPDSLFNVSCFNDWTNEHVAGYQPRSQNGRGSAITAPGLGIDIDESKLDLVGVFE